MGFGRAHLIIRVLPEVPCSLASLEPIGIQCGIKSVGRYWGACWKLFEVTLELQKLFGNIAGVTVKIS